jgi:integrase
MKAILGSHFDTYFKIMIPEFFYDVLNAKMLFYTACRPMEFLNVSASNLDLNARTITFTQIKDGLLTTRPINADVIYEAYEIWRLYGSPRSYYNSYSSLLSAMRRVVKSKYSITTRLNDLYAFRYSAAASLKLQGASDEEVIEFFNHRNSSNTIFYINQGLNINRQLTT